MIVTLELEDGPFTLFARHLAEKNGETDIGEYLRRLLVNAMDLHPDNRNCSNPECCAEIQPIMIVTPRKFVPNPDCRYTVSSAPNPICPECGANSVDVLHGMKIAKADPKYVQQLAARLDLERRLEGDDAA